MFYSVEDVVPSLVLPFQLCQKTKEPIGRRLRRIIERSPEYIIEATTIGSATVVDSRKWIDQATGPRLLNHFQKGFCRVNVAGVSRTCEKWQVAGQFSGSRGGPILGTGLGVDFCINSRKRTEGV